jgi:hypothetical protein
LSWQGGSGRADYQALFEEMGLDKMGADFD